MYYTTKRFQQSRSTPSVITTYEKGLTIYGLSPTQQQVHYELLQDLQTFSNKQSSKHLNFDQGSH